MKKIDVEKYITNLSPKLQEKARACKNMDEFKKFIAKNDVELPESVLEAISGGVGPFEEEYTNVCEEDMLEATPDISEYVLGRPKPKSPELKKRKL